MAKVIIQCWEIHGVIALVLLVAAPDVEANNNCGVRVLSPTELVVQGTPTKPGDWPWHIALFRDKGPEVSFQCGGSIISNNFALTAAHCFKDKNPKNYFFKAGVYQLLNESDPNVVRYQLIEVILYPQYEEKTFYHDIALIRAYPKIQYKSASVLPVCLWSKPSEREALADRRMGVVAGFGKTEKNVISEILQQTSIRIVAKDECRKLLPANTHYLMEDDSKLCGVGEISGSNVCEGDSGGGLYVAVPSSDTGSLVWFLRGIVSAAPRKDSASGVPTCDPKLPAVYTDVEKYTQWIAEHERIIDERNLLKDANCGVVKNAAVANETAKPVFNQYPWNALLEFRETGKRQVHLVCSGVLVHRRYVLTVGHCTHGIPRKYTLKSVRLGEFDIRTRDDTDASAPGQTFVAYSIDIEKVIPHPSMHEPAFSNNLALLKLKHDADTTRANIQPICLPSVEEYKERSVTLTGWKRSKHLFPTLHRNSMNISSAAECQEQYSALQVDLPITGDRVCASYNDRPEGQCHSYAAGSPLQYIKRVDKNLHYYLAGLMVFSQPGCRTNATEVFVNLNGATEWIKQTVLS